MIHTINAVDMKLCCFWKMLLARQQNPGSGAPSTARKIEKGRPQNAGFTNN